MDRRVRGEAPWVADPGAKPADHVAFDPGDVEGSIGARFWAMVDAHGDRPALVGPDGGRSYASVGATVAAAAHRLTERGVVGRPVALLFDHGPDVVEAVLSVLDAGGIVLVLDPEAPHEVTAAVLTDARPALVVHDDDHLASATELAVGIERVAWAELGGAGEAPPRAGSGPGPDDPALLAYTSGTTAHPKAAALSHRALLHLLRCASDTLAIAPSDRLPMLFPPSLAVAAYPMLLPLVNGAALCSFDLRSLGLAPLPEWLDDRSVTVMYFSPTVARFMATDGERRPNRLRLVVLGGERVDDASIGVVRSVFGPEVVVANGYGTTETGVLTFFFTRPGETYGPAGVPVGRPIEGMELFLLDVDDVGVGELQVRSRYLFDGYWGNPDATGAVLSRDPGTGMGTYRTGDLARIDDDGCVELVGRSDSEIKVRGHRVVPGQVEQALLALSEVADAIVEGRPDPMGTNLLVAWVVPSASVAGPGADAAVRTALAARVKSHLVPTSIAILDELPQLPNGKLDRRALPDPMRERPTPDRALVLPRDEYEQEVAEVWRRVLGVHPVGVHEDFFELGGQSLDAARVLAELEARRGQPFPMADLIGRSTVEQMAQVVRDRAEHRGRRSTVVRLQEGDPSRPRLFFVHDLYGTAWTARHLARELGPDQPVHGFESPVLRGPKSPFRTLQMLALRYVTDLRLVQPNGPYHLAGYSFGGVLAFEVARQLVAEGEEVAFLGVIDVGPGYRGRHYDPHKVLDKPYNGIPPPPEPDRSARERGRYYLDMLRRDRTGAAYHVLIRSGLDRWTDPLQFQLDLWRHGRIDTGRRLWYGWRQHWKLARTYDWDGLRYPGRIHLFWAAESASSDATMGWGPIAEGGVDIERIDVPHEAMLREPGVAVLGAALRRRLDEVAPRRAEPPGTR